MDSLKSILKQPLLHFLLIGALLFVAYDVRNETPETAPPDEIRVTQATIDGLSQRFQAVWRRAPTESEMAKLIDDYVREEILVREAVKLGLDQNDAIVRQRLILCR